MKDKKTTLIGSLTAILAIAIPKFSETILAIGGALVAFFAKDK